MRQFVNLPHNKQIQLQEMFPNILDLFYADQIESFELLSISVFDRWLTREETIQNIDHVTIENEKKYTQMLHTFSMSLYKSTECYLIKLIGRHKKRATFRKFVSDASASQLLMSTHHMISDRFRFYVALPEYQAIYVEGADFTHHLFFLDRNKLSGLIRLVKDSGLHIL
ncbi:hypothetical protein VST7929_03121 [Vibrio stylophorae]|uniref:Uncharacterized protein n=1 Tax=Vibrio stylophorae TaxID=659351 RepID=A0ABM8ZXR5_9VIBR|nr:hypothetical protein [Vibrio stylophorae]CAH0535572.1 hypothetical protein VST7929_03121 [Vibrio stylophorae]